MKRTIVCLCAIHCITSVYGAGMLCSDSLYAQRTRGVRGELLRSWDYPSFRWQESAYEPRSKSYSLASLETGQASDKYMNLDWLATGTGGANEIEDFLKIDYQREAKTYLFVTAKSSTGTPSLPGWLAEGWARRPSGAKGAELISGVSKDKKVFGMSTKGYIFSRTGISVTVPSKGYLKKNIENLDTSGHFSVLIAEKDGSAPSPPTGNKDAEPGKLCPSWLHDQWVVSGFDEDDPDTVNRNFRTFHPLLDPCFFCSYGHEHGSNAPSIMGYWPRYGYMALKNGDESESHEGFKDYVLDLGDHYLYYNVHAHLSRDRRLTEQFHTNVIRIVTKRGLKKMLHVQYKAFYGPLVGLDENGKRIGLTPEDSKLRAELGRTTHPRREVQIRTVPLQIKYEIWSTVPMCSNTTYFYEPTVFIKDPQTGLEYTRFDPKEFVTLTGKGINREFRSDNWIMGLDLCECHGDLNSKELASGYFYTDPKGKKRVSGPGPSSVKQYIAPSFSISVSGRYEPTDNWIGLYGDEVQGRFFDVNQGVIAMMN